MFGTFRHVTALWSVKKPQHRSLKGVEHLSVKPPTKNEYIKSFLITKLWFTHTVALLGVLKDQVTE